MDEFATEARAEAMDDVTPAPAERHRARSIVATVLGVLTVLVLVVAVVAVWARATVLRRGPVADARRRRARRAGGAGRAWPTGSPPRSFDRRRPPEPGHSGTARPAAALRPVDHRRGASRRVERALDRRARQRARSTTMVETLVERAHASWRCRLLEGDGLSDGVTIKDGVVTLNLLPLIDVGARRGAGDIGLLSDVTLPDLEAGGDPQQQIAELSAAINRPLPGRLRSDRRVPERVAGQRPENLQIAQRHARALPAGRVAAGRAVRRARRGDDPRRRPTLAGRAGARHRHGRGDGGAALGGRGRSSTGPRHRQQAGSEGGDRAILEGVSHRACCASPG